MSRRALLLTVLGLLAGCDGGPTGRDLKPAAARLHVVATYVDSVDSYVDVMAWLVPGVTEDGHVREVLYPVLEVAAREIAPTGRGGQPGELNYRARWEVAPGTLAETALTFVPPQVEGVTPTYGPVRWFSFGRSGGATLAWSRGEDLLLDLKPPAETSTPLPGEIAAELMLKRGGGGATTVRVPLPPVDPIVVPEELMPESPEGTIQALLAVSQYRSEIEPGEEYEIAVLLAARVYWEIRVVENGS